MCGIVALIISIKPYYSRCSLYLQFASMSVCTKALRMYDCTYMIVYLYFSRVNSVYFNVICVDEYEFAFCVTRYMYYITLCKQICICISVCQQICVCINMFWHMCMPTNMFRHMCMPANTFWHMCMPANLFWHVYASKFFLACVCQ